MKINTSYIAIKIIIAFSFSLAFTIPCVITNNVHLFEHK